MEQNDETQVVVPVVQEELHADTVPVKTGGVRVTKHVEGQDEVLEQELRRGHVQVKRVKLDRVVDGPQPVQRVGNTVVVPVVSERLRIEKEWVVTEEIHITQLEELERFQQTVRVNQERADVERLDDEGNPIAVEHPVETTSTIPPVESIIPRRRAESSGKRALSRSSSILNDKRR